MNIQIAISLVDQDRERLDAILGCLQAIAGQASGGARVVSEPAAPAVEVEEFAPAAPVDDVPWEEPAPAAPAPAPKVSLAELQKVAATKCAESAEKKQAVKALLVQYAPALSQVPEDKRAELLERLTRI